MYRHITCFPSTNMTYPKSPCDSSELIKKQGVDSIPDLAQVMCVLATESIPNLPPGGELASKWVLFTHNTRFHLRASCKQMLFFKVSLGRIWQKYTCRSFLSPFHSPQLLSSLPSWLNYLCQADAFLNPAQMENHLDLWSGIINKWLPSSAHITHNMLCNYHRLYAC